MVKDMTRVVADDEKAVSIGDANSPLTSKPRLSGHLDKAA
jgi:hypothetical protein